MASREVETRPLPPPKTPPLTLSVIDAQKGVVPPTHLTPPEIRPPSPERAEILALSKSIIRVTAGYDIQLRQKSDGQQPIVDSYAYKPREDEVDLDISREKAIGDFEEHARKIDQIGLNNLPPEWEYIRDSQRALAVYLREGDKLAQGQLKTPYKEYIEAVDGYQPRLIPWPELDGNLGNIINILEGMGEKFDPCSETSIRRVVKRRSEETKLDSQEDVEQAFWRADRRNRSRLAQLLGEEIKNVRFELQWSEENAFWRFFESIGPGGKMILRSNWHERQRASYDNGLVEMYGGHEPSHFIVAALIGREITQNRLDPAAGLLIIPSPIGFQMEGIAQTIGDIAGFETTQDGKLAVELYRMEKRALANGLYLAEEGIDIAMVAIRIRKYMPRLGLDEIRRLLKEGTEKPFERAFLVNYGRSDYAIMTLKDRIGDLRAFLDYWFKKPLTPRQFLNPPLEALVPFD